MQSAANVNFVGSLARDPETKYLSSGTAITTFSVPVNTGYGDRQKTTWYNVAVFGKRGEQCAENLKKGSVVFVSGEQVLDTWDKPDGTKGFSLKVTAESVKFLDKFGKGAGRTDSESQLVKEENEDEIPF